MKRILKMINALDKIETISLGQSIVKKAGIGTLIKEAKAAYPDLEFLYIPGKGYISNYVDGCPSCRTVRGHCKHFEREKQKHG